MPQEGIRALSTLGGILIIRGANSAITREDGCTVLDLHELLPLMTRRERIKLIRMLEAFNTAEQRQNAERVTSANRRAKERAEREAPPPRQPRE